MDLKNIPAMVDEQVALRANKFLGALGETLGWSFGETLDVRLAMPPHLAPMEAFTLAAGAATVEVLTDALRLDVSLPMQFRLRTRPAAT